MYTDPCTIALRFDQLMWEEIQDMPGEIFDIEETKFIISGRFERPNGHVMRDELAYISATKEQAIATCQRLNPHFHIHTVREEM